MFRYALAVTALLVTIPVANANPGEAQNGGMSSGSSYTLTGGRYFAISGCFRSWGSARARARRVGGYAINTSNYGNFRAGYRCAVRGPSSYGGAKRNCRKIRRNGYACYVKAGY